MKSLCLILLLAIGAMPGCSHNSSSTRQERAYAKYVQKSANAQAKRQKQFRQERATIPPAPPTSEPQITMQASEASEPSSGDSGQ